MRFRGYRDFKVEAISVGPTLVAGLARPAALAEGTE
jgi:hypothetical protein